MEGLSLRIGPKFNGLECRSLALASSGQTMMGPSVISPVLNSDGCGLPAGSSVSLSYSGLINLGGGVGMGMPVGPESGSTGDRHR